MLTLSNVFPVPGPSGREPKYPWGEMKVGDSFFVEGKTSNELAPVANYHAKRRGTSYTCRAVDGGVRVWRVT